MKIKILRNAKISVKLTLIYALMFSLILLVLNAAILYGVKYYLYNQGNKEVEDVKTIVLNKVLDQSQDVDLANKDILSDVPYKQDIHIRIIQENGTIINSTDKFKFRIRDKERAINDKIMKVEEGDRRLLYENVKLDNNAYGVLYIQIVKDMDSEYDFLQILFIFMAVADFIGMIASIILGYVLSKRMLKPIDDITKAADNISINNLKERIDVKGPEDELKRLGDTFNNMIDRLQESFNKQTQFVSDASHELRTPIAVIQGYANLLHRWGKDDREALEKSIHAIRFETDNMVALVEKLLFLAKGDSGSQKIEKKEFQLNELINEVVEESRLIAEDHIIENKSNDEVKILADYKMIKQLLRIFIDNSVKFTSKQGKIDISSKLEEGNVKITVSDNGIGIPKEEIENIFNRFYTVDKSRSKDKGGTGLGLSIAKWIVEMHQGDIEVESEEGIGTSISVRFKV
ncbi:sensor histidine kinase [Clostridium sp. 'White wine YQ']|uniref:sensor histidine kinase n=1 Tax=Clostridium sp. 'White wine YQ' TaxID=3027474 RepID=UPI0023654D3D|nr:ATP-binding protein [Clostridium sp. 'White wine YQ']MDD7795887.1 ATP-binding protein [Clostridium sp. 'White wine YQ']